MRSKLCICQINARHSLLVMESLGRIAFERHIDVLLIQEPPLALVRREWSLRGYRIYVATGNPSLTAIMVRSDLSTSAVDVHGSRLCGIVLRSNIGNIWLFSSYIRSVTGEGLDHLTRGLDMAMANSRFRLVGMDSNGHSPLWGPSFVKLDKVGGWVEEALAGGDLFILNHCDAPASFHGDSGQQTWIDVTAASPALASRVDSWAVCTSVQVASDHYMIQTLLDLAPTRDMSRQTLDWGNTDWDHFSTVLQAELGLVPDQPLQSSQELDQMVEHVTGGIQHTMESVVPTKRVCQYSRPWWNADLRVCKEQMNHWRRRWVRTGLVSARERYLVARRTFRNEVSKAKQDSWRRLCSETSREDLWSLYKRVMRKTSQNEVEALEVGNRVISSDAGKAVALAPIFFPSLPPASDSRQEAIDLAWSTSRPPGAPDSVKVSPSEVHSAIRAMRVASAPGVDTIPVSVLKRNLSILVPWLVIMVSASLSLHYFPRVWRLAKVLALKKPGKSTYADVRSYRPISLLSHLGKVVERIVNRRLMAQLESRCLLSPYQFGFRAGRQTMSACGRIVRDIYTAFRDNQQIQAVSLDIQAAYNSVWHSGLLKKIAHMGVDDYLLCWVQSYLEGRVSVLVVGDHSAEIVTSCGVPQGSPISSTLFLVFIDDLLRILQPLGRLRSQAFADDLFMWAMGFFRSGRTHPHLRQGLLQAEQWSRLWRIRFSPQKCECITFTGKHALVARPFRVFLYGEELPHTQELRYLGVWFDEHLTWRRQIHEAVSRARLRIWELRRVVRTEWGLHTNLFLRLVRGVILPSLFYGAPVWASVLRIQGRLEELDRVIAVAARLTFSLERFTSTEAALVLSGLGPARHHILRALVRFMHRHRREALLRDPSTPVPLSYITPDELGAVWFYRAITRSSLEDVPSMRPRAVRAAIDSALDVEWHQRWRAVDTGRMLYELMSEAGGPWEPEDADSCRRRELVIVARFMTGHCHLGGFRIPRDDFSEDCPLCGEAYYREHFIRDCEVLTELRARWLLAGDQGDLSLKDLAWKHCSALGNFLLGVRELLGDAEDA